MKRLRLTLVLTLGFFIVLAYPTKAQDSGATYLPRPHPIIIDKDCKSFTVDGRQISYDSCKHLLMNFRSSATELKKVLRLDNRLEGGWPIAALLGLPTMGFLAADKITDSNTPWVTITAVSLDVLFLGDIAYLSISRKHKIKHLRMAIGLYNTEIDRKGQAVLDSGIMGHRP
jgi:hypothetical protein